MRFENASRISFGNNISGAGTVALAGGGEVLFKGDVSGLDATLDICASVTLSGLPPFKTIRNSSGGTVTVSLASGLGTVMWDGRMLEDGAIKFRIAVGEGTLLDLGGATLAVDRAVRDSARRIVNGTLIETDPESSLIIFIR